MVAFALRTDPSRGVRIWLLENINLIKTLFQRTCHSQIVGCWHTLKKIYDQFHQHSQVEGKVVRLTKSNISFWKRQGSIIRSLEKMLSFYIKRKPLKAIFEKLSCYLYFSSRWQVTWQQRSELYCNIQRSEPTQWNLARRSKLAHVRKIWFKSGLFRSYLLWNLCNRMNSTEDVFVLPAQQVWVRISTLANIFRWSYERNAH